MIRIFSVTIFRSEVIYGDEYAFFMKYKVLHFGCDYLTTRMSDLFVVYTI